MTEFCTQGCPVGWIWLAFIFALGGCVGSFLNVVIYRLPLELSIVSPPSACPTCKKRIKSYDNIPLISWFLLGGKCRFCKSKISVRYFLVELLTALMFVGVFVLYFGKDFGFIDFQIRPDIPPFASGGWLVFVMHIVLLCCLVAGSAIDLQHWVIPLSICWLATLFGMMASSIAPMAMSPEYIANSAVVPFVSANIASMTAGAILGLILSLILLYSGLIKQSYEPKENTTTDVRHQIGEPDPNDPNYNHRAESLREILFLLPVIAFAVISYILFKKFIGYNNFWQKMCEIPYIAGFLGAFWGYFAAASVVWGTRILGTFAFGKEAMGLGDVHLLAAAGACLGAWPAVIAFFIAPFMGLLWALYQMFFKKCRQIPYGPFLSLAIFVVIVANKPIMDYIYKVLYLR